MSYQFLDAYGSVLTADSSIVSGSIQRPIINIGSIVGNITTTMSPASVSGVGLFNVNQIGSGSVFTAFRNDALASTVGIDLTSRLVASDSAGRIIYKPFAPDEARVSSVISTTNSTSTSLLAGSGAGLRTYITDLLLTNSGSVATVVAVLDGDNSVMGRTIAPATSGSNVHLSTPFRTNGFNQQVHITATPAVSVLGVTVTGYKAP